MKKFYFFAIVALLASAFTAKADGAKWEQVQQMQECYQVFATSHGTLLSSDQMQDLSGGIWYSEDHGDNWTKCDIEDLHFAGFFEYEDYVYALGTGCMVARSEDWGRTWELFDYLDAADELVKTGFVMVGTQPDNTYAFSGVGFDGKIYVANMNLGVFVSENFGETWTVVDPMGLSLGAGGIPYIYTLLEYNDKVYAFGAYTVFELIIEEFDENTTVVVWMPLYNKSNFLTQVAVLDDVMIGGRGIANDDYETPFMVTSKDGYEWEGVAGRPQVWDKFEEAMVPLKSNYVSAIATYRSPIDNVSYVIACTQNYGVFSSTDMGATWADFSEGFPCDILNPTYPDGATKDDTYLYISVFVPDSDPRGGVYRFPLAEIPRTQVGIDAIENDEVKSVEYFDLSGRKVVNPTSGSILIKKETTNNGVKATKFISE